MVQRKRQIPLDGPCKPQSLAEINRRAAAEGLYASCTRVTRNRCESTFRGCSSRPQEEPAVALPHLRLSLSVQSAGG
jgi:hypothetical protein